jgi:predicted phage terminase large subunit-like protein
MTEPIVAGYIKRHGIRRVVFEANNGGDFYSRDVSRMLKEDGIHCNILALRAPGKSGKLSRIIQHAPAVKEWYFRDQSLYSSEEYYGVFMSQLLSFVQTGKSKHDDAPDSCAGLAHMMRKYTVQQVKFSDRRSVGL